jgi:glutamyl-tRNA synthetase
VLFLVLLSKFDVITQNHRDNQKNFMKDASVTKLLNEETVRKLFPDHAELPSVAELETLYPQRDLSETALVTRFAPSPTGFVHLGAISTSLINRQLAKQSGGQFLLRIEDTDSKRRIDGAFDTIVKSLDMFGLQPDEGFVLDASGSVVEKGAYGPYAQSDRLKLHRAACLHLVRLGRAYPCFAGENELKNNQEIQRLERVRTGYYGRWAPWRGAAEEQVEEELTKGTPFVIRFRSNGSYEERFSWFDGLHGRISVPQNDIDSVILKSDGTSLYHLAHVVDDRLMRVTDVIRGDEWLSSVPLHLQLFEAFSWQPPRYTHLAPIQKLESIETPSGVKESRRKLSKRKDPEANIFFYYEQGVPRDALLEYLLNIADSEFELWRQQHPEKSWKEFEINTSHFSKSGALVDMEKIRNVGKEYVGRLSLDKLYEEATDWCQQHDEELYGKMTAQPEYTRACLDIERDEGRPSKRIAFWSDLRAQLWWFYDDLFQKSERFDFPENVKTSDRSEFISTYLTEYRHEDTKEEWFGRCKSIAERLGYAIAMKKYKKNPEQYKGSIADATMLIRVGVSSQRATPDLYQSMQVLGEERVLERLKKFI